MADKNTEKINSPYENFLGMHIAHKSEGFCKIGLTYKKELTNPHGDFHGGAIASIIDTAVVQSLRTITFRGPYLTAHLSIRFKMPAQSREIFAQAWAEHWKGKFFRTQVKVLDKQPSACCDVAFL